MSRKSVFLIVFSAAVMVGCGAQSAPPHAVVGAPIVAEAREAGMVAITSRGAASVRVLYARNGGMVFLRDVRLPPGDTITGLALSADGEDLVVDTNSSTYTISTRTWSSQPARVVAIQRPSTADATAL